MTTIVRVGFVAAFIGAIVFGVSKIKDIATGFSVDVVKYGLPKISNAILTLPIQLRFHNPGPVAINIDRFVADISLFKVNTFQKVAQVSQAISIPPGDSLQVIYTQLNFKDLFGGNLLDFALNTLATQSIKLRTDITAYWNGIPVRPDALIETISLKDIHA
jgi:hypothetical protein